MHTYRKNALCIVYRIVCCALLAILYIRSHRLLYTHVLCVVCCVIGVWDMRGKQFHRGVEIHCWGLAVFAQYRLCPEDKLQLVLSLIH